MRALEFTCNFRDVVLVAVHTGYTSREYNLPAQLRTDGSFIAMKVIVTFGDSKEAETALDFLENLTNNERIGCCRVTID